MGKNRKFRGGKRNSYKPRQGDGERGNYPTIPSENANYERYYRESGLISEEEWDDFWGALCRTLPTTFRFTGSKGHALRVLKALRETHIPHLQGIEWEGQPVSPPTPLPWYPDDLAWQLNIGKSTIRRCPPFKKFQNFLVAETTVGNISRQEAVSMIPPLLMDIEPHHAVLDMCAAPGSKTAQLLEAIHAGEEASVQEFVNAEAQPGLDFDGEAGGRPTGLVIANDSDYRRSHMLIHQTKRLNSANLIVTNHDATMYPSLLLTPVGSEHKEYLKFDRILADVPCSGDGTARKNPNVWRDWAPISALGLHLTQTRILVRGLQMLKVGGRIVYSTCSMNPVENEAVVAAAIYRCGGLGKVALIDCKSRLPELKRRPGVKGGWKVMDKDQTWFGSFQDVLNADMTEARQGRIVPSMFPSEDGMSDNDPARIPLERCIRVYPHLQDTGGFFIAVLEKKAEIGAIKPEDHGRKKMAAIARSGKASGSSDAVTESPMDTGSAAASSDIAGGHIPFPKGDPTPPGSPSKRKIQSAAPSATPPVAKKIKPGNGEIEEEGEDEILETPSSEAPETPRHVSKNPDKKNKGQPAEEFFKYLAPDHPVLETIVKFYELSPRFPRTCFMVRNEEGTPSRTIYFTNHLAKRVLMANGSKNVKFVHCGVKAFMKQDVQEVGVCEWRIQSEGLSILEGWIGEGRVVRARKQATVHGLLKELFPKVNREGNGEVIGEIEDRVRGMPMGCCVLKVDKGDGEDEFSERMVFPLWRSRFSCNMMLPKEERKAMLMRLFNDEESIKDSTSKNSVQYREEQERASDPHLPKMKIALAEAKKCTAVPTAFCVGAVLAGPDGVILSTGYSREHPGNTHAEQVCLDKLQGSVPEGAVLYTTMEPCSERLSGNKPCVQRILENGNIRTVYVGIVEPSTFVENTGKEMLEDSGVGYVLVRGLEKECLEAAKRGHESVDVDMAESAA